MCLLVSLPLEDALCDGCHSGVMTPLDGFQCESKAFVVVVYLRWPFGVGGFRVVSVRMPVSAINSLFLMQNLRPFLDRYPKTAPTKPISVPICGFTYPTVEIFLTGKVWRGLGE